MKIEEVLKERINENYLLFKDEEKEIIFNELKTYAKIYLLGIIDINKNSL